MHFYTIYVLYVFSKLKVINQPTTLNSNVNESITKIVHHRVLKIEFKTYSL